MESEDEVNDQAEALVAAFLAAIVRRAEELDLTHSALARAAFPGSKDPVGRWRKIRRSGQHLTLADAWRLARTMGVDINLMTQSGE